MNTEIDEIIRNEYLTSIEKTTELNTFFTENFAATINKSFTNPNEFLATIRKKYGEGPYYKSIETLLFNSNCLPDNQIIALLSLVSGMTNYIEFMNQSMFAVSDKFSKSQNIALIEIENDFEEWLNLFNKILYENLGKTQDDIRKFSATFSDWSSKLIPLMEAMLGKNIETLMKSIQIEGITSVKLAEAEGIINVKKIQKESEIRINELLEVFESKKNGDLKVETARLRTLLFEQITPEIKEEVKSALKQVNNKMDKMYFLFISSCS